MASQSQLPPDQPLSWTELLPDKDFGFSMRFRREDPAMFFRPTAHHHSLTQERTRWLDQNRSCYAQIRNEGAKLLDETLEMARAWNPDLPIDPKSSSPHPDPLAQLCLLGSHWEPDFLLLSPDSEGLFRLQAGVVCFPSSWALADKMGQDMAFIHGPVPGLNAALGPQISSFLSKIKPDIAWLRENWGLSRSPELNQHPRRNLPKLDADVPLHEVWLRVEHQALIGLPKTGGVLFGIRLSITPLSKFQNHPQASSTLARELQTMPDEMASYKNLLSARETILAYLTENHP